MEKNTDILLFYDFFKQDIDQNRTHLFASIAYSSEGGVPLSILTATTVFPLFAAMSTASAWKTCPKAPSPSWMPKVNLQ